MVKKLQTILLYALILTLPFNIRYIFNFSEIALIDGFKEHLTISLYFFDFIFILLLFVSVWDNYKNIFSKAFFNHTFKQPLIYFGLFILFLPLFNHAPSIAWYKTIRLLEMLIFFTIVRNTLRQYTVLTYFKLLLFVGGVIQSAIALLQFITQQSLGLSWLGESIIGPNILGVAKFSFEGEKLIRAYGTFPHPNVLGIFLLFSLSAGLSLMLTKKELLSNFRWRYRSIFFGELFLIYVGLLLTYSRSIILLTAIISFIFAYSQRGYINKLYQNLCQQLHIPFFLRTSLAIIVIFTTLFASYNLLAPRLCLHCPGDESISLRKTYQRTADLMILQNIFTGVGLGNFIQTSKKFSPALPSWNLQPVHNLYLLIASELGLIGLLLFLVTTFFYSAHNLRLRFLKKYPLDLFFILVLLAGFFDHYFWTLQQGQLIFWIALALVSIRKTIKVDSPTYHFKSVLKNVRHFLKELS
jgi:hypothetical protein